MGRAERSIVIKAEPEKIWAMLAWDRFPEWDEGSRDMTGIEYTSEVSKPEDKLKVGASARVVGKGLTGKEAEYGLEIIESIEYEKIEYRASFFDATNTFLLEPVEEGTKLTYKTHFKTPWGILGKSLDKLVLERMGGKEMEKSLEKLKSILEK